MQLNVTTIPATITPQRQNIFEQGKKRRVAAYARVSTDSDEQFTSFEAQVEYYTNYINDHEGWEMAGIYTDEGISAVNTKRRDGFKQMIQDAMAGKIDLIVTNAVIMKGQYCWGIPE